jgi:hypothetical protein
MLKSISAGREFNRAPNHFTIPATTFSTISRTTSTRLRNLFARAMGYIDFDHVGGGGLRSRVKFFISIARARKRDGAHWRVKTQIRSLIGVGIDWQTRVL